MWNRGYDVSAMLCDVCVMVPCVPDESCSHWLVGETEICFLDPVNISEASFETSENAFPSSLTNVRSLTLGDPCPSHRLIHLRLSYTKQDLTLSLHDGRGPACDILSGNPTVSI